MPEETKTGSRSAAFNSATVSNVTVEAW
jgi:hypothetical protein